MANAATRRFRRQSNRLLGWGRQRSVCFDRNSFPNWFLKSARERNGCARDRIALSDTQNDTKTCLTTFTQVHNRRAIAVFAVQFSTKHSANIAAFYRQVGLGLGLVISRVCSRRMGTQSHRAHAHIRVRRVRVLARFGVERPACHLGALVHAKAMTGLKQQQQHTNMEQHTQLCVRSVLLRSARSLPLSLSLFLS